MRKVSANYIYCPDYGFLKFGIIVLDDKGNIVELVDTRGSIREIEGLEFYSGLIVVGRIEALELEKYLEREDLMLEEILSELLEGKNKEGLSILSDVDLIDFKIRSSTKLKILI